MQQKATKTDKEQMFMTMLDEYDAVVRRVCFMYSNVSADFEDLYQETMANLWRGITSFRGDAKMSTWIYRTTVNTCITWLRRNSRHANMRSLDEAMAMIAEDDERRRQLKVLYEMISRLDPLEKALMMMWLDGRTYDEIAEVIGISRQNVAVRLHRIKVRLRSQAQ